MEINISIKIEPEEVKAAADLLTALETLKANPKANPHQNH
jgi:hypothetical protein